MLGEIRLGFFADGLGYYKDCSELLYKIDSQSDLKVFKEGELLEIDEDLFKIESIELGFMPYPGKRNFYRQKPIKLVYVSKASPLVGTKKIDRAVNVSKVKSVEEIVVDEKKIKSDPNYTKEDFKSDFPHVIKEEKPKRKVIKNKTAPLTEGSMRSNVKAKGPKVKPKSPPPPIKKSRTVKNAPKTGKVKPQEIKKAVKKVSLKKEEPNKRTRRSRCKQCKKLFKSLGRHKCKG